MNRIGKKLILEYGCGSVQYINVKLFKIKYPFLIVDRTEISLRDVKFIKYKNEIIWRNRRKR